MRLIKRMLSLALFLYMAACTGEGKQTRPSLETSSVNEISEYCLLSEDSHKTKDQLGLVCSRLKSAARALTYRDHVATWEHYEKSATSYSEDQTYRVFRKCDFEEALAWVERGYVNDHFIIRPPVAPDNCEFAERVELKVFYPDSPTPETLFKEMDHVDYELADWTVALSFIFEHFKEAPAQIVAVSYKGKGPDSAPKTMLLRKAVYTKVVWEVEHIDYEDAYKYGAGYLGQKKRK